MSNFEVYYDNPKTHRRERLIEGQVVESLSMDLLFQAEGVSYIRKYMEKIWLNRWEPGKGRCP
jgi:hypothetical protein